MRSRVAEALHRESVERTAAMEPKERLRLALALGMRDVTLYATSEGVTRQLARVRLKHSLQRGRRPSAVFDESP